MQVFSFLKNKKSKKKHVYLFLYMEKLILYIYIDTRIFFFEKEAHKKIKVTYNLKCVH